MNNKKAARIKKKKTLKLIKKVKGLADLPPIPPNSVIPDKKKKENKESARNWNESIQEIWGKESENNS